MPLHLACGTFMFAEEIRFCELVSEQVFNWCSALGCLRESEEKVTGVHLFCTHPWEQGITDRGGGDG